MKIVVVTWLDAYSFDAWLDKAGLEAKLRDQPRGALTITPGLVFADTENGLVLVQSFQRETEESNEDFSGMLFIPRGMIQEVRELGEI